MPEPEDPLRTKPETPEPDPEGIEGPLFDQVQGRRAETVWLHGTLVEKHDQVVVVSFPTKSGGRFSVSIDRPRWNCDSSDFQVGDPLAVRGELYTGPPDTFAVVSGQAFHPEEK